MKRGGGEKPERWGSGGLCVMQVEKRVENDQSSDTQQKLKNTVEQ